MSEGWYDAVEPGSPLTQGDMLFDCPLLGWHSATLRMGDLCQLTTNHGQLTSDYRPMTPDAPSGANPMTEQLPSPPAQDSDYDGAWKEALRRFLRKILECYFPAVAAAVAWEHPPVWSDKELSQILGQTGRRNRTVDVLVKLRLRDGGEQWILLHLEIQTSYEEDFAERLALYNSGLFWIFKQRVVTLAVLADLREGWLPDEDRFQLADFETRTRFPVCKLIDRLRSDWQDDYSLPVQLARAQIAALRTAGDPEGRYQAKWQLVRKLYEMGYNAEQVRELFGLIDWMMHLRVDLEQRFKQELDEFEESLQMPYVTSVERIAKSRRQGRRRPNSCWSCWPSAWRLCPRNSSSDPAVADGATDRARQGPVRVRLAAGSGGLAGSQSARPTADH